MRDSGIYFPDSTWYIERIGKLTSSKIHDAITPRKRGEGELAARRNLKMQMLAEMVTGQTTEHYVSAAMDWGIENESKARAEYEYQKGQTVVQVGLVFHPDNDRFAATPDGWVKEKGLLEIKCPETYTHLEYMASGAIPEEYRNQIMWQMACAGPEIEWVDFVSFDPRIDDEELRLFVVRQERDEKRIREMEDAGSEFLSEVIALFEQIKRGAKGQTLESKLRESIREAELRRELASVESGLVP